MHLIVFTGQYPYGTSEVFLEDELRVAENEFDEITIVTYAKASDPLTRYIPSNAHLIHLRRDDSSIKQVMPLFKLPFTTTFWREFITGCHERGFRSALMVMKKIIFTEKRIISIERKKEEWISKTYDCIYYSYWINPAAVYLARNIKSISSICIARCHGEDCFFDRGYVPWRSVVLNNLRMIYPISEMGKKDILKHYSSQIPLLEDKLTVARLGVRIPKDATHIVHDRKTITIVSCSNVIQLKRLDLIIETLSLLNDKDIHWVHFGDGPLMEEIKDFALEKLEHINSISYEFRGRVPVDEILNFYRNSHVDIFINCSDVEGIPVSAMEAMAYGIPVIARDVGGNSELIDNENGYLVSQNADIEEIAHAIEIVINNIDDISYQERSQNARARIIKDYNSTTNYMSFFRMVKNLS